MADTRLCLYLIVVLLAGAYIQGPTIQYPGFLQGSTHDGILSTGDHGRDLYAFSQTMQGKRPYHDYWWVYGPVMPYYYGLMMKALGANMHTVYAAQFMLQLVCGVLFFLLCSRLMPLPFSLIGSVWFLFFNQNFYHTYNNIGGIVLILAVLFCLVGHVQTEKKVFYYVAQPLLVLLMLVKFNIGAAAVIAFYLSLAFAGAYLKKLKAAQIIANYGAGIFFVLLAAGLCYGYALWGLPQGLIQEYFPLFDKSHTRLQPLGVNVLAFFGLYGSLFTSGKAPFLLALLVLASALEALIDLYRRRTEEQVRMTVTLLVVLGIFYLALLHEYLLTGIFYRIFWSVPLTVLFMFVFIDQGTQRLKAIFRFSILGLLSIIIATQFIDRQTNFERVSSDGRHYWDHPKAELYVNNESAWIETINAATGFLESHLKPSDLFLALPYEPMYYFLTSRESPVPRLVFYDNMAPKPEEELQIINALHQKSVDWILLSNAVHHEEESFGVFGITHCVELGQYIQTHYVPVADFGDFEHPGSWSGPYAVRILKRHPSPN